MDEKRQLISELRNDNRPGSGEFYFHFKVRGSAIFILLESVTKMVDDLAAEAKMLTFEEAQQKDTRRIKTEQLTELQNELTEILREKGSLTT